MREVEVPDEETVTKILINNQVLIIRGGKIYTMMGVEIDIDTNMWFPDWQDQFSEDRFGDNSSRSSVFSFLIIPQKRRLLTPMTHFFIY